MPVHRAVSVLWYDGAAMSATRTALDSVKNGFDFLLDFDEHEIETFNFADHIRPTMAIYCNSLFALEQGLMALRFLLEEEMPERLVLFASGATQLLAALLSLPVDAQSIELMMQTQRLEFRDLDGRLVMDLMVRG